MYLSNLSESMTYVPIENGTSLSAEEEAKINKHEHAKFLLYQIQQDLDLYNDNKDCSVICQDGTYRTSNLVIQALALSMGLPSSEAVEQVFVIPDLLLGELLLFIKYVFTNKVQEMFNGEDVSVIEKIFQLMNRKLIHVEPQLISLECDSESNIEVSTDSSIENLTERRLIEKNKLKTSVTCIFCTEILSFSLLSKHIKLKHPESENICLVCHQNFQNKNNLGKIKFETTGCPNKW